MRYTFLLLIFLHAIIHLFGFFEAYHIIDIEGLHTQISKFQGVIWLLAAILLFATGILNALKISWWWMMAIFAIILSQLLIIQFWSDAKYGTLPNFIILLITITYIGGYYFQKNVSNQLGILKDHFSSMNDMEWDQERFNTLPIPIQRWLATSGVVGRKPIHGAYLRQKVSLKMKPEQDEWTQGHARQIFTTSPPSFIWSVDLKMKPFLKIVGRDRFINGKGSMIIKLLSLIPIVNVKDNPKINEAALQRYLAEMVLFPTAMLNNNISWTPINDYSALATIEDKGTIGKGTFYFNNDYKFERFEALRYKDVDESAERIPWIVTALDHREINDIIVPTRFKVEWEIDGKKWEWLKMQISDLKYIDHFPEKVFE